jgi:organic radical activating enzyme
MTAPRTYRVNEIFYSLQGEGYHTGRAAVFVRFAGCNLRCSFCDTEFDSYREMTADEIVTAISQYPARFVVLTGGEPTLQVDEAFVDLLHQHRFEVAMESNGTRPAPQNLDWLTVSPKRLRGKTKEDTGKRLPDELKVIFDEPQRAATKGQALVLYDGDNVVGGGTICQIIK